MEVIMKIIRIAIDGGAASGKSTISKLLATEFNLLHVDTGSHYRVITAVLFEKKIPIEQKEISNFLKDLEPNTLVEDHQSYLSIYGINPKSYDIRSNSINDRVSQVASIPSVRAFLLSYQRSQTKIVKKYHFAGLVMEGRDIGSVVMPDAEWCFFFHASAEDRQRRRDSQGQADDILKRDLLDSSRSNAPLKKAPHAIPIDTGVNNVEEVLKIIKYKLRS